MLSQRIKKLILVRLLVGALLLYCPRMLVEGTPLAYYSVSVAVCGVSIFYLAWYLTRRRYRWLSIVQILGDIGFEGYLVFITGGAESLFAALFVLSILSSALVVGDKRVIVTTTVLSCASYMAASITSYAMRVSSFTVFDPVYFSYGMIVRIGIFFLVGHLSRYLSDMVLELENRLKLSERLSYLGEVLSKVSHEIRNPLSSIRTAAEVLRDSLKGKVSAQDDRMLEIVDGESERLIKTFQRILNYAKQVQPDPKLLLLDPLVERTLAVVRLNPQLHPEEILVVKKYDCAKTHVYADEEQILSALLNLFQNAYQAMGTGKEGTFKIRAEENLQGTRIDLEDTGGGIPRDKMKELFLPFKSTKKGGTGLGLAEVHKIVTLHEGKIEAESLDGKGTIFHLFFPKP